MRRLIIVFITILVAINMPSCAALKVKTRPDYKDVDPRAQSYVDEYMDLSKQNHLEFKHKVTLGFKHIKQDDIIGLTTFGYNWREIDIDIDYWNQASKTSRLTLIFHELSHAYCGREHDYAKGKKYPEKERENSKLGRYQEDFCPISIMYPVILDDECVLRHYDDYTKEMFHRCVPY